MDRDRRDDPYRPDLRPQHQVSAPFRSKSHYCIVYKKLLMPRDALKPQMLWSLVLEKHLKEMLYEHCRATKNSQMKYTRRVLPRQIYI